MGLREEIIEYGYLNGKKIRDINNALSKANMGPMGPRETALIETNTWGTTPIERVARDAKEFTQGLNTLISAGKDYAGKLVTNPQKTITDTQTAVNNYLSQKGVGGAVTDLYNMMVEPYGLDTNSIQRKGLGRALYEAPGNMWAHPGYTAVDFASLGRGRVPTKALGNILEAKNAPKIIRDFIPSEKVSKVNDIINSANSIVGVEDRNMALAVAEATRGGKGDIKQAVRNLETGTRAGDEATLKLTDKLADISDTYNKQLLDLGVDANKAKQITIAQYMLETLNPDRTKNIHLNDIIKWMQGIGKAPYGSGSDNVLKALQKQGEELFAQGKIKPISHRATFKADPGAGNLVTDTDRILGHLADRRYGWATPEELAPTLFKAYEGASRELRDANVGRLSFDEISRSVGTKVSPQAVKDGFSIADNEVVISPQAFNDILAKDFNKGNFTTVSRRVEEMMGKGLAENRWKDYANDLYVVKKDYLNPLSNRFAYFDQGANAGRKLNSTWKTAQLITPKYWLENRTGNTILNMLEGVTPQDYLDAMRISNKNGVYYTGKYHDIRPERLKTDTSYFGVLGEEFRGAPAEASIRQATNTIKEGVKELSPTKAIKGTYDLFSAPVLAFESQFEALDRYANFIRQAKRLSKETGESVGSIIKRSSKDNKLYAKLMKQVNRSLGDYIGRNWAINPNLYEGLSFMFPFFKYPTQGLRTLAYQAINKPARFHSLVTAPQRIGRSMWLDQVYQHPELAEYNGGVIDTNMPKGSKYYKLRTTDVHPLGAGAGLLSNLLNNWEDVNLNPITDLGRIISFRDRYGNIASSPRYINSPGGGPTFFRGPNGEPTPRVMEKPSLGDYLSYLGAEGGNLFIPAVKAWNSYIGPSMAGLSPIVEKLGSKPLFWYPRYNTSMMGQITDKRMPKYVQPFVSGKTDYPGIKGLDAISKIIGTQTLKVYPKQSMATTNKSWRSLLKRFMQNQQQKKLIENGMEE